MWTRKYKPRPPRRLPLVHEQIVMQCARNIVRVAASMPQPQPRCPSGLVPVVVEVRRSDQPHVYRYQVNISPSAALEESFSANDRPAIEELPMLPMLPMLMPPGVQLGISMLDRPPCPMHGPPLPVVSTALEPWAPLSCSSSSSSDFIATNPMVLKQCSMHVVNRPSVPVKEIDIASFNEAAVVTEATDEIRTHLIAALYHEERTQLHFSEILLQGAPSPQPLAPVKENFPDRGPVNENVFPVRGPVKESFPDRGPVNGVRLPMPAFRPPAHNDYRIAELCLDSNGDYVKNERLFPRAPNGCCSPPEKAPSGINGIRGDLNGYIYMGEKKSSPRNGYKTGDQPAGSQSGQDPVKDPRCQNGHQPTDGRPMQGMDQRIELSKQKGQRRTYLLLLSAPADLAETSDTAPANYPVELQTLFRWNYCCLCNTTMRTVRNAVDHYSSRAHDRRVGSWMVHQYVGPPAIGDGNCDGGVATASSSSNGGDNETTGADGSSDETLRNSFPDDYYCELCDLQLTSLMHAQQHFLGRRHRMVAQHQTRPNGEGYYDGDGRWVRTDTKFLICELCDVSITSESQMATHMAGARHRRRVQMPVYPPYYNGLYGGLGGGISAGGLGGPDGSGIEDPDADGGLASFNGSHMYRVYANGTLVPLNPFGLHVLNTPPFSPAPPHTLAALALPNLSYLSRPDHNAAYYCVACNVTLNHLKSVKQHEDGRLHRRNVQRLPGNTAQP
ncbi:hypothetical protein KR018_001637 [Drosophila ironensis]|nr:hypothetical protein KR018_001637 [Drosophila ironensis]